MGFNLTFLPYFELKKISIFTHNIPIEPYITVNLRFQRIFWLDIITFTVNLTKLSTFLSIHFLPKTLVRIQDFWLEAVYIQRQIIPVVNTVFNNENCKRLYNLLRNRINRDLKKSKKQYYEQYFTEHVNNIKKTWDGIKKIVNLKKNSNRTSQLNVGSKVIDDNKEIATNFNHFFVNVVT